jgi:hypothetical protein
MKKADETRLSPPKDKQACPQAKSIAHMRVWKNGSLSDHHIRLTAWEKVEVGDVITS